MYIEAERGDETTRAGCTLNTDHNDSPELKRIMGHHLPQWAELFAAKNEGYQSSANDHFGPGKLGARGQYVELFRKMGKLHRALWDGEPLHGEAVDEVLMDLIGHCFLAIDALAAAKHCTDACSEMHTFGPGCLLHGATQPDHGSDFIEQLSSP